MTHQTSSVIVCLFLAQVAADTAIHLTMDRTPGWQLCGYLQCHVNMAAIMGMSIFNVTRPGNSTKLASVSAFAPRVSIEQCKAHTIDGIGSITGREGHLALRFQDVTDCLHGSFLCEVNFINGSGQPDTITEMIGPGNRTSCSGVDLKLDRLVDTLDMVAMGTHTDLAELQRQSSALHQIFDSLLDHLGSLDSQILLYTRNQQVACPKGLSNNKTRQEFQLWGHIPALCDTQTDGGDWVVVQRRTTGDVDFNRGWAEYKRGFGTPSTDYWIGLDVMHSLTSQGFNELRVELNYGESKQFWFAQYSNFSIADEAMNYQLTVSGYSGTANDALRRNNGKNFSTYDRDNDGASANCADTVKGGWWYSDQGCWFTNLNALWGLQSGGVSWSTVSSPTFVRLTEMKLRRSQ